MASTLIVVSDMSGTPDAKTYTVVVGTKTYEVDLTESEFAEYQQAVAKFVAVGRPAGAAAKGRGKSARAAGNGEVAAIKAWGAAHGYDIPKRGRLSADLRTAYAKAMAA